MGKCEHVVAMVSDISIREKEFQDAVVEWVKKVKYYNENTLRLAIEPPANLITCSYCPACGEKLDKKAKEKVIATAFEKYGDGRDAYDDVYKAKNNL